MYSFQTRKSCSIQSNIIKSKRKDKELLQLKRIQQLIIIYIRKLLFNVSYFSFFQNRHNLIIKIDCLLHKYLSQTTCETSVLNLLLYSTCSGGLLLPKILTATIHICIAFCLSLPVYRYASKSHEEKM